MPRHEKPVQASVVRIPVAGGGHCVYRRFVDGKKASERFAASHTPDETKLSQRSRRPPAPRGESARSGGIAPILSIPLLPLPTPLYLPPYGLFRRYSGE